MTLEDLKSQWQQEPQYKKNLQDIERMTRVSSHPVLKRIRIKIIIESCALTLFFTGYYSAFDGNQKPLWVNAVLLCSGLLFIANDLLLFRMIASAVPAGNVRQSVQQFIKRIRQHSVFAVLAALSLGSAIILFLTWNIRFTPGKYVALAGMILTLLIVLVVSWKNWQLRIRRLQQTALNFKDTPATQ